MPKEKSLRYQEEYKIKKEDAEVISNDFELASLLESSVSNKINPVFASEWIRREVTRVLNYNKKELDETFISKHLIEVMELIKDNKITRQTGQKLMELLIEKDLGVKKYVLDNNLSSLSDTKELGKISLEVIKNNQKAVKEYLEGNEKSFNFLVGQIMKSTKGKGDPKIINELLKKLIQNQK